VRYLERIDELRRAELFKRASEFAAIYKPELPTVVILPGGMGSRLQRAFAPFDPDNLPPAVDLYELWASLPHILDGQLRFLAHNEATEERDHYPIVPYGELTSIVKSYDGIFDYFEDKANVVSLGYDWRRAPAKECGYVTRFLELIVEQVKLRYPHAQDPRKRLTLYAHSQGGLVAKLFVNELVDAGEEVSNWFERLVTCCTPFYGTNSHFSRYYTGEPLINIVTGGADAVAKIVATFQGTYCLLPAPRSVLGPRLAKLGLQRYPVRDYDDRGIDCDPFDGFADIAGRYRAEVSRAHLVFARDQYAQLDRDLPPEVAARVFHIRSDANRKQDKRDLELRWKRVDGANYSAAKGNPIYDNMKKGGRGDGTVPLWSAALAGTPDANVFDLVGVEHGGAAEHACSLYILAGLMNGRDVPRGPHVAEADFEYASRTRAAEIVMQLKELPPAAAEARFEALPEDEYRAIVDGWCLSA